MSISKTIDKNHLITPVAVWIKKPWQEPRLAYISVSNIKAIPAHPAKYNFIMYSIVQANSKHLNCPAYLNLIYQAFTAPGKTPTPPVSVNANKTRRHVSLLRFIFYTIILILLLPFFLIDGGRRAQRRKAERRKGKGERVKASK